MFSTLAQMFLNIYTTRTFQQLDLCKEAGREKQSENEKVSVLWLIVFGQGSARLIVNSVTRGSA